VQRPSQSQRRRGRREGRPAVGGTRRFFFEGTGGAEAPTENQLKQNRGKVPKLQGFRGRGRGKRENEKTKITRGERTNKTRR
jgi:hypothetical protein